MVKDMKTESIFFSVDSANTPSEEHLFPSSSRVCGQLCEREEFLKQKASYQLLIGIRPSSRWCCVAKTQHRCCPNWLANDNYIENHPTSYGGSLNLLRPGEKLNNAPHKHVRQKNREVKKHRRWFACGIEVELNLSYYGHRRCRCHQKINKSFTSWTSCLRVFPWVRPKIGPDVGRASVAAPSGKSLRKSISRHWNPTIGHCWCQIDKVVYTTIFNNNILRFLKVVLRLPFVSHSTWMCKWFSRAVTSLRGRLNFI